MKTKPYHKRCFRRQRLFELCVLYRQNYYSDSIFVGVWMCSLNYMSQSVKHALSCNPVINVCMHVWKIGLSK